MPIIIALAIVVPMSIILLGIMLMARGPSPFEIAVAILRQIVETIRDLMIRK